MIFFTRAHTFPSINTALFSEPDQNKFMAFDKSVISKLKAAMRANAAAGHANDDRLSADEVSALAAACCLTEKQVLSWVTYINSYYKENDAITAFLKESTDKVAIFYIF